MKINFELYKIFYITAKSGSLSKAAKKLYTSQPAISRSIKILEENIEGQLFNRTPRGVDLTEEGKILYNYIEQSYNLIETAERKFQEIKNLNFGQIRLSVCTAACKTYFLDHIFKFNLKYPNIKISVQNKPSAEIMREIEMGNIDIGVLSDNDIKKGSSIKIIKKFPIQDCFVVGEKYKYICKKEVSIKELSEKYPISLLLKGSVRNYIEKYFVNNNAKVEPYFEASDMELSIEFAKKGMGIACVIKDYVKQELKEKKLFEINIKEQIPKRIACVAIKKNIVISKATQKFIDLLLE